MSTALEMGLHRRAAAAGDFGADDVEVRNRTWWCIYSLERQVAVTTGRVLSVRDHAIDAPKPVLNSNDALSSSEAQAAPVVHLLNVKLFNQLEGVRAVRGRIQFAKEHICRLFQSAKAMYMDLGLTKAELLSLLHQTLDANAMNDEPHVHIRLVVSRGLKSTPYQNPHVNIGLPLIVIIPEIKAVDPAAKERGLRLGTTWVRRGPPDVKDEQWNHISKATDVQACVSANVMGVDEALMLDLQGFVKTCNSVNFFIVRGDEVWAPTKDNQMQGITRQKTIDVCRAHGVTVRELDFALTEVYGADEAFCTGTFPSQVHVTEVDGRKIGNGQRGALTAAIQKLYAREVERDVARSREEILADLEKPRDLSVLDRLGL
ncbi:putative branched-chain-amino-acid aminotransferase [Colletotrichum spinosum]|uniref:Putative branched-chain-amino-acid aminotransferase n=1 Tax=Colletotrichum spinosum TaxID=1347390 RepID=A0A4R8Q6P8_9PEZI|nr:putative branched-chain-amino-acid aminotransferase [Colletotrichum spinosum]